MSSGTKPPPLTAEEMEKQAEKYRQLALSDHMDAGRFAQAHASLLSTAAELRYRQNLPELVGKAMADLAAATAVAMRPEEQ